MYHLLTCQEALLRVRKTASSNPFLFHVRFLLGPSTDDCGLPLSIGSFFSDNNRVDEQEHDCQQALQSDPCALSTHWKLTRATNNPMAFDMHPLGQPPAANMHPFSGSLLQIATLATASWCRQFCFCQWLKEHNRAELAMLLANWHDCDANVMCPIFRTKSPFPALKESCCPIGAHACRESYAQWLKVLNHKWLWFSCRLL